jgi:D-sedoheptulose 7-phosphate isomerase
MKLLTGHDHVDALACGLAAMSSEADRIERWGRHLARILARDGRLLAAGNGGSAAQAQHLTGELVGRYRDDRRPYSAIPLCTDSASVTAIGNDYGADEVFARQVRAHGRPGDVLVVLSTSGGSPNVIAAAEAATRAGLTVWALTGRAPNALERIADEAVAVPSDYTPTVQELHLVAIHMLCAAIDAAALNVISLAAAREARAL